MQEIQPPPQLTIPAESDDEALEFQMPYCPNIKHDSLRVYKCLLGSLFVRKTFPAGTDIAVQGSKAEAVIYIEDGECEILFSDRHGDVDEDFEGSDVSSSLLPSLDGLGFKDSNTWCFLSHHLPFLCFKHSICPGGPQQECWILPIRNALPRGYQAARVSLVLSEPTFAQSLVSQCMPRKDLACCIDTLDIQFPSFQLNNILALWSVDAMYVAWMAFATQHLADCCCFCCHSVAICEANSPSDSLWQQRKLHTAWGWVSLVPVHAMQAADRTDRSAVGQAPLLVQRHISTPGLW